MGRKPGRTPNFQLEPMAERIKSKVPEGENAAQYIHKKMNALGYSVSPPLPYDWISAYAEPTMSRHWIGLAKALETSVDWLMTGDEHHKSKFIKVTGKILNDNGSAYYVSEIKILDKMEGPGIERRRDSSVYLEIKC